MFPFKIMSAITATPAAIAGAIAANSVKAAPAALAKAAAATAFAQGTTACGPTFTLIKALQLMAWTKAKTAILSTGVVGLATLSVIQHQRQVTLSAQNESLQRQV